MQMAADSEEDLRRILCVDDERNVLSGLRRELGWDFEVLTAPGGAEALELLEDEQEDGGIPLVISDMRMPGMDGAEFLEQVRRRYPDTVRILLTGQADIESSVRAVNHGRIWRFLTKPCPSETLREIVREGLRQHDLQRAEKVLLEQTLKGAVRALTATLAMVKPDAFGVGERIRERARMITDSLAKDTEIEDRWAIDIAADLALVPLMTLPDETLGRFLHDRPATGQELALLQRLPEVTERLLGQIPRIEPVQAALRYHLQRYDGKAWPQDGVAGDDLPLSARILRVASDFERLLNNRGETRKSVLTTLVSRKGVYDPKCLAALVDSLATARSERRVVEVSRLIELTIGAVVEKDVLTRGGTAVVKAGARITQGLKERLHNFEEGVGLRLPLTVSEDVE